VSPAVQALLSLHGFVFGCPIHAPFTGLHVSVVHTLLSLQLLGAPVQVPAPSQTSLSVHPLPSLQVVSFVRSNV
jgi:hypothetical protein